jgi:uncharacterized repeat protein (TIGR03803 family)
MTKTAQLLGTRLRASSVVLALAIVLVPAILATPPAKAQTFTVLYDFKGENGDAYWPVASLVRDAAGNLYGTTYYGGTYDNGTVYEVDSKGNETVLYSFSGGADGGSSYAGLTLDAAGNLYGTTYYGGSGGCNDGYGGGCGVVFELSTTGQESVLHSFSGGADGKYPLAILLRDSAGNLYGTASGGGAYGYGTVFMIDSTGNETVLYSFTGSTDGANPGYGVLVRAANGTLYGTTGAGGDMSECTPRGCGTVFKLDNAGRETVLYSFTGGADGAGPVGLVRDAGGNLYGTTGHGGAHGAGTVFKVDKSGKETVLHSFSHSKKDGRLPFAGVIRDPAGNLYGTTYTGGTYGNGTLFKVDKKGKETVLHSLTFSDGGGMVGGLVRDAKGNLYGAAQTGGTSGSCGSTGCGTVFVLNPKSH